MTKFVGLEASYLIDDVSEDKKRKGTKTCVIKIKLEFENCENCLEAARRKDKVSGRK